MNYHHCYAIIPYYGADGANMTYTIHTDGSKESHAMPIKSYIQRMLYHSHLDPKALQYWTSNVIGTKLNTPLTLTEDFIFIPVKIRHAIGKSDGCFGYVLSNKITSYNDASLILDFRITLETRSPSTYIAKKQRDARLLRYAYIDHKKIYEFMLH